MSSGRPARLRAWNAAAITLLIAYLAGLGLFCATALAWTAKPQRSIPPPFDDYAKQTEWWPIAVQLGVGLAAFFAYYIPRRHESRSFSLLITGGLGVTTLVLGAFSVWNCTELETPFFTPMAMALGLVLGNKPDFTGHCDESGFTAPLALQVARLSGPLLLVITALGIVTALFRTQLDRLIVRFSRALVVVIGLSEEAIPLLKRLAENLPRGTTLAVLIENSDDPLTKQARTLGARVVVCNLDKDSAIRVLVLRQNRFKVDALYVVSTDVPANLAWAKQFREIADASRTDSHDPPPRIIARIDDPWQAEYWRRTNAYRTPTGGRVESVRWVPDALSIYEVTATMLVTHVQSTPHDRLVVVGRSPLALAICAELAQREREGAVLRTKPEPSLNELVLVGLDADKLREQHQIRQERFGNAAEAAHIDVELTSPTEPALATLLAGYEHPAVIFADDLVGARKDDLSATLLAALHPNWTIYHSDSATVGLADRPIMERLFPFGSDHRAEGGHGARQLGAGRAGGAPEVPGRHGRRAGPRQARAAAVGAAVRFLPGVQRTAGHGNARRRGVDQTNLGADTEGSARPGHGRDRPGPAHRPEPVRARVVAAVLCRRRLEVRTGAERRPAQAQRARPLGLVDGRIQGAHPRQRDLRAEHFAGFGLPVLDRLRSAVGELRTPRRGDGHRTDRGLAVADPVR